MELGIFIGDYKIMKVKQTQFYNWVPHIGFSA